MQSFDPNALGPLDKVRVIDMSRLVAGNMTTHVLADYGADVIKIERPGKGDDLRNWRCKDQEIYWKVYARNKRSFACDIKTEEGREDLVDLLTTADVLVENFVPGTLEKWNLGPEDLHRINPKLVILRISGWGQTGPYRNRPGFGTLVEAMSGWAHLNGHADKPPTLPPLAMADMVAGLYGVGAVLTALRAVEMGGGKGQVIDLSLFEPILSIIASEAAQVQLTGEPTMRAGNQSSHTSPRNVYLCADGKYVALSGSMQSMAMRIMDTIGQPQLKTDPRFATNDERVKNRDELDAIIAEFISRRSQAENLTLFEEAGVTVGPVCSMGDLIDHPYVREREVLVDLPDEGMGSVPMHNIVPRMSLTPGQFRRPAPQLGEHNAEIGEELKRYRSEKKVSTHA
ncbi:CaiB/BaiF CoA transferase family protein [Mariluticola halotolerans]|uniref:CaiB/BaiF CoA transferase family protein n=1 Tax=Mariluticola halotolerans TaxID=2909283 RepID=UPI0026E3FBB7|nr:CoA transferase [Mariluticola halotolerans]UJQ95090.1 CoA transferase [Mariluticola halotolerans]